MAKIIINAAMFSGNQGAAGMLHSTIQNLPGNSFYVFTVYPESDKALNQYKNVEVVSATPKRLVVVLIPAAIIYAIFPPVRAALMKKVDAIAALATSSIQIDLAGISFADGRKPFLIYNIATILPALFMKLPIVKFAQASGPFKELLSRTAAKLFLPRIKRIYARGNVTRAGLDDIDLKNVESASDVAFLFAPEEEGVKKAHDFLTKNKLEKKDFIVFSPSAVLFKKAQKQGIDYIEQTAKIIDELIEKTGVPVVILPHAIRLDPEKLHNNDLVIVDKIMELTSQTDKIFSTGSELYASGIKTIIGQSKLVVAARFHAMIGALSTATPVVVTGWSHKYQEVLDSFKLDVPVVYLDENYASNTVELSIETYNKRNEIKEQIQSKIGTIKIDAQKQISYVEEFLRKNS